MRQRIRMTGLVLAMCTLAACEYASEPDPLKTALLDAPPELVFKGPLAGQSVHLVVHDCAVYKIEGQSAKDIAWTVVLETEPYPFFTRCARQSLSKGEDGVTVELGKMAFGAGGCCATGGTYRTTDGRGWKKL
ncbi:hypothetical protein [Pseudomonas sp. NFACC13-1]|uniref:hypothetical protein n=1 Tax=Pseudomonas sp. NFACC13-1 TaxID=1566245 RepID=UPI00087FF26D|nr:hypothetical protein [Pseudomonas sp. NFACC13-1]SDB33105.1 hypothetical protein SAMN03159290_02427 [Pseudomonas sp. NFACC13-1]